MEEAEQADPQEDRQLPAPYAAGPLEEGSAGDA